MIIDPSDGCSSGGTNVSKDGFAGCIGTDATKIRIMKGWLGIFVKRGMLAGNSIIIKFCCRRGIPRYTEAVDVEKAIASCDFMLCGNLIGIVGEEFGKVAGLGSACPEGVFQVETLNTAREPAWQESAPASCISCQLII